MTVLECILGNARLTWRSDQCQVIDEATPDYGENNDIDMHCVSDEPLALDIVGE
jgi:hypothetical protein